MADPGFSTAEEIRALWDFNWAAAGLPRRPSQGDVEIYRRLAAAKAAGRALLTAADHLVVADWVWHTREESMAMLEERSRVLEEACAWVYASASCPVIALAPRRVSG